MQVCCIAFSFMLDCPHSFIRKPQGIPHDSITMAEKILIVDDDIDSLKLIGLMLQRQGYEIAAANSGNQALTKAVAEAPDLIILDVMMPDMDGYEVCRRLRANTQTQDTPIIMFTAKTLVDDKVAGFEAGADDYLTKPTHPAELASRVKAILSRSAAKRQGGQEQGLVVAVLGAKGGVGTTTIAANVASVLAHKEPTVVADLRPGQGSLGLSLGFPRAAGMATLLTRPASEITARAVTGEIVSHSSGLRLLLSSARPKETLITIRPDTVMAIIRQLRAAARIVILDIGAGFTPINQHILREIDHLVLVVDSQRVTLNMAKALLHELKNSGLGQGRISITLVNHTHSSLQITWQEAEQILEQEMTGIISPAPELAFQADEAGTPMVYLQPNAVVANQLVKLSEEIGVRLQIPTQ